VPVYFHQQFITDRTKHFQCKNKALSKQKLRKQSKNKALSKQKLRKQSKNKALSMQKQSTFLAIRVNLVGFFKCFLFASFLYSFCFLNGCFSVFMLSFCIFNAFLLYSFWLLLLHPN